MLLQRAGHRIVAVSGRADTVWRAQRFLPGVPVVPPRQAVKRKLKEDATAPPDGSAD